MIYKKRSIYFTVLVYLLFFTVINNVYAGIINSPHDIRGWFNYSSAVVGGGICNYCHMHSCKGVQFPEGNVDTTDNYGKMARTCWKCHGNNLYLGRNEPVVYNEIYKPLDKFYAPVSGDMDSHPVRGSGSMSRPEVLKNTYIPAKLEWPSTKGWESGKAGEDIECTTCHNIHDWNSRWDTAGGKRKFLRAPLYYESAGMGYNFCVNCHFNKESDTAKNNIENHLAGSNAKSLIAEIKNNAGMIRPLLDSSNFDTSAGDRGGRAIWDSETATNIFLGFRSYENNVIICQTCHMPHGARQ